VQDAYQTLKFYEVRFRNDKVDEMNLKLLTNKTYLKIKYTLYIGKIRFHLLRVYNYFVFEYKIAKLKFKIWSSSTIVKYKIWRNR